MTFSLTINTYQAALLRLVTVLVATAGIVSGEGVSRLPRFMRKAILSSLRPLEAAAMRLIVVVAREMAAQGLTPKSRAKRAAPTRPIPRGDGSRMPSLPLFDPRKRVDTGTARRRYAKGPGPRIRFFDGSDPVDEPEKPPLSPNDPVDATRLCRRMMALQAALGDLAKQGRRLMRMQARARGIWVKADPADAPRSSSGSPSERAARSR